MSKLTHFDPDGRAHMVDVGSKPETHRVASAAGRIVMLPATLEQIQSLIRKRDLLTKMNVTTVGM